MTETISPEVECLKLKATINENHRLAQKSAGDAIERAVLAGELLCRWKELLTHGKFEVFVEKHFDGSARTARMYMQAAKGLNALPKRQSSAVLLTEDSMAGLLVRLKKDDPPRAVPSGSSPRIKPKSSAESKDDRPADSSGEDAGTDSPGTTPQETDPRPPRSGKDKPGKPDYGKCPNCAGIRWDVEDDGVSCSKCHHPHGEPADKQPEEEDHAETLRSKTVKTMEAAMRCFDDLNLLVPKAGAHKQVIELCKNLLKSAKGWK